MKVTFKQQWRGHMQGAVTELKDERAVELISLGVCVKGEVKPKRKRTAASESESEEEEN